MLKICVMRNMSNLQVWIMFFSCWLENRYSSWTWYWIFNPYPSDI